MCFAVTLLIAAQTFKFSPTVQFYIAVPLAVIAGFVCLVVAVEKT